MSGKLLMFAKLSLKNFIYEITETFCFPKENVKKIYDKYKIEKVEIFHILTDTDSTALKFMFISDPNSEIPEDKFSDIIFEVIVESEIYKRFDSSHEFWDVFNARKKNKRKKLGHYGIENISDPCLLTLAVNPKEYLELVKSRYVNKKHKGIKKESSGLGFKNFAQRIKSLVNIETFEQPPLDQKQVSRIAVDHGEMVKKISIKSKFSQLNDKRFFFPDGVDSPPFGHPNLKEIVEFKKEKGQKIEKYFWEEKEHLFNLELKALKNHTRLYLYNQILMSVPKLFNISQKNDFTKQKKTLLKRNTKDIILKGGWIMK